MMRTVPQAVHAVRLLVSASHLYGPSVRLLVLLLVLLGCEDNSPTRPDYQVGAIEGFVRTGGVPLLAEIRANPIGEWDDHRFRAQTDSTGRFHMDLQTGAYRLSILPPKYPGSVFWSGFDSVHVRTGIRRFDLNKGRVRVRLALPAFLEGRSLRCDLKGLTTEFPEGGTVQGGILETGWGLVYPGRTRVTLRLGDKDVWLPGTLDPEAADIVDVGVDRPTVYEADLSGMTEITGVVHGSWETLSVFLPDVAAFNADSVRVGQCRANRDGSFALDFYPAEPVRLLVGSVLWSGGASFETAAVYDAQPGVPLEGVSIRDSGILCHLDPTPRDTYRVSAVLFDAAGREVADSRAYEAGRISFAFLPAGRYFLRLVHDCDTDWVPMWYDGAESFEGATPIDVPGDGAVVEVTAHLVEGGRIDGEIRSADGASPGYRGIRLLGARDRQASLCETGSDVSGAFAFRGLGDGAYALRVDTDAGGWWYPGTADPDSAGTIAIVSHGAVSGITWRLPQ